MKKGQMFNALIKKGLGKGKVAHGCPCKCEKVAKNSRYKDIHAEDSDSQKRLFSNRLFTFEVLT